MPITCPECEKNLKIEGKTPPFKVRCPACGHVFDVLPTSPKTDPTSVLAKAPRAVRSDAVQGTGKSRKDTPKVSDPEDSSSDHDNDDDGPGQEKKPKPRFDIQQ